MADLSDFKRGQIVGAEYFSVARNTVSKVMAAFEKEGRTFSLKQNSGRKRELIRTIGLFTQIVRKDHKNTAPKITAELNNHLESLSSSKRVRRELH